MATRSIARFLLRGGKCIILAAPGDSFAPAVLPISAIVTGTRIKYWTGAAWVAKPLKKWTGAAWVPATLKRWNGAIWINT